MSEIQQRIDALRALVEKKQIECPCVAGPACSPNCSCHNPIMSGGCKICTPLNYSEGRLKPGHTAHRLPDPNYAPLLAVVREAKLIFCEDMGCFTNGKFADYTRSDHLHPGYITRNWEGLPPGALIEALTLAYREVGVPFPLNIWEALDPDGAALDAVLLALGAEVPDATM